MAAGANNNQLKEAAEKTAVVAGTATAIEEGTTNNQTLNVTYKITHLLYLVKGHIIQRRRYFVFLIRHIGRATALWQ